MRDWLKQTLYFIGLEAETSDRSCKGLALAYYSHSMVMASLTAIAGLESWSTEQYSVLYVLSKLCCKRKKFPLQYYYATDEEAHAQIC